jgi:hypothetical protein
MFALSHAMLLSAMETGTVKTAGARDLFMRR